MLADKFHFVAESPGTVVVGLVATLVIYRLWVVVYNLFFHPLARSGVPGPKLAAATFLTEWYYNTIKDGQYYREIEKYHAIYGPIVRVTPDECHINDPDCYNKIYKVGSKYTKDPNLYFVFFGDFVNIFATINPVSHRAHRALLSPLFSRKSVNELESTIHVYVNKICSLVRTAATEKGETGQSGAFDMRLALTSFSVDVITAYGFGRSWGLLSQSDMGQSMIDDLKEFLPAIWTFRMMPQWFVYHLTHVHPRVAKWLGKASHRLACIRYEAIEQQEKIRDRPEDFTAEDGRKTLYAELLRLAKEDKDLIEIQRQKFGSDAVKAPGSKFDMLMSARDFADDAMGFVFGGLETLPNSSEACLLGILGNKELCRNLTMELRRTFVRPEDIRWEACEKIPLLVAALKEGLRLAYGNIGRPARVVQEPNVQFFGHRLPIGSVVSQSAWFIHRNEKLYPEPDTFDHTRWIGDSGKYLDKYMVAFGKDSRNCLGMHLAYAEMYVLIANLLYRFDMEIAETSGLKTPKDLYYADYFVTHLKHGKSGLQVIAKPIMPEVMLPN